MSLEFILRENKVVPVVVLDDAAHAVPLARALFAGGIKTMEITFRTAAAEDSIRAVAQEVPDMIVGAGTVTNRDQFAAAVEAGARFIVSPGLTPILADCAREYGVSFLPGVVTPTEIIRAMDEGFYLVKFFPAKTFGGAGLLKQYASVFPQMLFCPTGGIDAASLNEYLSLPNVVAVGGSWLTPKEAVLAGDWAKVTALGKEVTASS